MGFGLWRLFVWIVPFGLMSGEMRMEGRKRGQAEKDRTQKVEKDKAQKLDLSGMSLNSLPNPGTELLCITKLDLSNNNLEVSMLSLDTP